MGTNDIGEQLAAAIETNIGAEAIIADALAITEAVNHWTIPYTGPEGGVSQLLAILRSHPTAALAEHDRALTTEHTALLAQVAAVRLHYQVLVGADMDLLNGRPEMDVAEEKALTVRLMGDILAQPSAITLAAHDSKPAASLPTEPGLYCAPSGSQNHMGEWHTDHHEFYYLNTVGNWSDIGWGGPATSAELARLRPVDAAHDAEVAAKALEEAARQYEGAPEGDVVYFPKIVGNWLRGSAAEYRAKEGTR